MKSMNGEYGALFELHSPCYAIVTGPFLDDSNVFHALWRKSRKGQSSDGDLVT